MEELVKEKKVRWSIAKAKKDDDDIDFISHMAKHYESRRWENISVRTIQRELSQYEAAHAHLEVVKRVSAELDDPEYRFFFYDIANDVLNSGNSSLNAAISNIYDGGERYNVATEMMEENHELFKKGLIEFSKKGNISDAAITLSDKGRKLVLADKAFLFEHAINDKNLIKTDCIKEKKGELMPILLFNEADALISKRKNDISGNCTQTENAIQNIILEELENLKGIFIATTNFASNMDPAFERRFLFKINFENPSTEAKTSIWMNKLTWLDEKTASEFARGYDFSGGQMTIS